MSQPLFVTPSGQPFVLDAARAKAALTPKRPRTAVAKKSGLAHEDFMSLGFVVEGLTREMRDSARDARLRAIANYPEDCETARSANRPLPKKPAEWNEDDWLRTARRVKARSRPFEIRAAAEECKALALKQGWLVVEISEVRRERK